MIQLASILILFVVFQMQAPYTTKWAYGTVLTFMFTSVLESIERAEKEEPGTIPPVPTPDGYFVALMLHVAAWPALLVMILFSSSKGSKGD